MLERAYANWMYRWECALAGMDDNRVVRPLEWGFDWVAPFLESHGLGSCLPTREQAREGAAAEAAMLRINELLLDHSVAFFGYEVPTDFRIEERHPELFPTNARPETLAKDAALKRRTAQGAVDKAQFLRFTSPERTPYQENDLVNARWYPAPDRKGATLPKQAIVVIPQWNADALSHNSLCTIFNRFGISALRLSMPYHDIRRPAESQRSDYVMSANIGRTMSACRQAVVDIRCCLDWLEQQGYEHLGVLGTSLGSCYAWMASTHDPRPRVNVFNHVSTLFGDVAWTGQSTRHIRAGLEASGLTHERIRKLWAAISPCSYYHRLLASAGGDGRQKRFLINYARYDPTFLVEYSLEVVNAFKEIGLTPEVHVLPCGHYTTGQTPFQYLDGWFMSSFVYRTFRTLRKAREVTRPQPVPPVRK